MWSVNLHAPISGEYQTQGGHSCQRSELLGAPETRLGAPTTSLGAPTTSLGVPETSLAALTTTLAAPTTGLAAHGHASHKTCTTSTHCKAVWEQ